MNETSRCINYKNACLLSKNTYFYLFFQLFYFHLLLLVSFSISQGPKLTMQNIRELSEEENLWRMMFKIKSIEYL